MESNTRSSGNRNVVHVTDGRNKISKKPYFNGYTYCIRTLRVQRREWLCVYYSSET